MIRGINGSLRSVPRVIIFHVFIHAVNLAVLEVLVHRALVDEGKSLEVGLHARRQGR